jgi:hypothetical protein
VGRKQSECGDEKRCSQALVPPGDSRK